MKTKFLVPEIDRKRWAKEFKERMRLYELKSKDLNDIGASSNSEQRINKLKNGAIPLIEPFLALCRFFNCPPDVFLYANPKWVECEIDRSIDDIWPWRILGLYKDTCYLVPNYEIYDLGYEFTVGAKIKRLKKEPDPAQYSNYHQWGTKYDLENRVAGGKIVYHFPYLDDEKTSAKIFSLLNQHGLSNKQVQKLLGLSAQSLSNRRCPPGGSRTWQRWTIRDIYKLSWILNLRFEDLLKIKYQREKRKSIFDPIVFIMHYEPRKKKAPAKKPARHDD